MNSRPAAYKAAALPTELWWRAESIGRCAKMVSSGETRERMRRVSFSEIKEKALFEPLGLGTECEWASLSKLR